MNLLVCEDLQWTEIRRDTLFYLDAEYDPFVTEILLFARAYLHCEVLAWGKGLSGPFEEENVLWLSIYTFLGVNNDVFGRMGPALCRLVYEQDRSDSEMKPDDPETEAQTNFRNHFERQPGWGTL